VEAGSPIGVLIADDDEDFRGLVTEYLARDGFEVIASASDAGEAIRLAVEHRPAAALVDVNMPGGGARAVIEAVRERSPDTAIVILSGFEEDSLVRGLLQDGAIAYMLKGASRDEILDTLRRAVGAHRKLSS
jgi:DNA-binding NarL/FixJ family response regulator